MNTFPMTELVIDELGAANLDKGKAIAKKIVDAAEKGNASFLKVLWDRIEPLANQIEDDEPLTDDQRLDRFLKLLERTRAQRARQNPEE